MYIFEYHYLLITIKNINMRDNNFVPSYDFTLRHI
jgi:hypothetical protein